MDIQGVIDRFEGEKAVLLLGETEQQSLWPRRLLPTEAQEGDILSFSIQIDAEATAQAKAEAQSLLKELLEKKESS